MKNYSSLLPILILVLMFSCKKDPTPQASPTVADPYLRYDNAAVDVDHQIFLFYKQTGIPILYTDTLTTKPLSVMNIGYHLTSVDSLITVRYLKNNADKLTGVNFIKDQVVPSLGTKLKPYSILMVDSVFTYKISYPNIRTPVLLSTYQGLTTLVIGGINKIKNMIPDSVRSFKRNIFQAVLTLQLNQQQALLKDFYAVSNGYYNQSAYGNTANGYYIPWAPEEAYGFLAPGGVTPVYYYQTPSAQTDLNRYLNVILYLSADEFASRYGNNALVMSKYNILKQVLITLGFKFS
jgi:hypothetical protein